MVAANGADDEPIAGAHVALFDAVGQLLAEAFTQDDGKATIPEVSLGSYVVSVRKVDYALARVSVDITRRETEVPVSLQPNSRGPVVCWHY